MCVNREQVEKVRQEEGVLRGRTLECIQSLQWTHSDPGTTGRLWAIHMNGAVLHRQTLEEVPSHSPPKREIKEMGCGVLLSIEMGVKKKQCL